MKKSTMFRSLLLSGLSVLLCVSMLMGSTFAWFTDSVESGKNTIIAGNLDVELWNDGKQITGDDNNDPKFFNEVTLWEPGAMAVETFTVKNVGTLALKYALEFNVSAPANGVSLAEALQIAVVEGELGTTGRIDPAEYDWQSFEAFILNGTLDLSSDAEKQDVYTFIVWWEPSDNDNDFNMNNENQGTIASVEFSLVLKATQVEAESDSFGNDYDADAVWADTYVKDAAEFAAAIENANDGDVIALMEDIVLTDNSRAVASNFGFTIPAGKTVVINLNGKTITKTNSVSDINGDGKYTSADNQGVFQVKGNLTVVGEGTISMTNTGADMEWNSLSAVFSVEGGELTLGEGVNVIHNGGTAMSYAVDVNTTLGETVLNVDGAVLYSTYTGVRVFNNNNTAKGIVNYNSGIISGDNRDVWTQVMSAPAENAVVNTKIPYTTNDAGDRYYFETATLVLDAEDLAAAFAEGGSYVLAADVELAYTVTVEAGKTVALNLNGHTITYNSTTQGEAMITNKGNLTINDTVGTGVINYNYTGAADPSYGKGNYTISNQGTLTVNGGKITIANLSGHAKYPIDNNSTTGDAVLVINGGHLYNYNTSAIRQFCNSTTYKNSVTINGGLVEGYCAIWMQNPGKNTVNGSLTITGGEIRTTAKAYVAGTATLSEVSSSIYCTISGNGGAWSADSFVSITGGIFNENVKLAENAPAVTIGENATFNGVIAK